MQNVGAEQLLQLTSRTLMGSPVAGLDRAYVERWLSRHRTALLTVIQAELTKHAALLPPAAPPEHSDEEATCHDVVGTSPERRAAMLRDMGHQVGLYVVACGAAKASEPCAAADLYTSGYFRDNLAAARALAGSDEMVRILSGRHGLVRLDEVLEPYDVRVGDRRAIAPQVMARQLSATREAGAILVFGGREYVEILREGAGADQHVLHAYAEVVGGLPAQRAVARAVARIMAGSSKIQEASASATTKLEAQGPECLADAKLLAVVLGGSQPGRAAKEESSARQLLERLGSLEPLRVMSPAELRSAGRLSEEQVTLLAAVGELARRLVSPPPEGGLQVRSARDVFEAYRGKLEALMQEVFMVLLLDARNRVISDVTVARGSLTEAVVHPREVFLPAVRASAAGILVLHNHPSGDPEPSAADLELTRRLVGAGEMLGIRVVDHVIVGRVRFVSLGERGLVGG